MHVSWLDQKRYMAGMRAGEVWHSSAPLTGIFCIMTGYIDVATQNRVDISNIDEKYMSGVGMIQSEYYAVSSNTC